MRTLPTCTCAVAFASLSWALMVAACQPRNDEMAQPNAMPSAAVYPGYPPGPMPQGATPTGYPPPTLPPGYYPPPTGPVVPGPAPGASPGMAVPGPYAFQCNDDVPCGLHHCNLQYKKCAFPCQSAADCLGTNSCVAGLCIPTPPAGH